MPSKPADICFEVSFECGNKVGGIYTVLTSKSKEMKKIYGKDYYTIGFYNPSSYFKYFVEEKIPSHIKKIFKDMEKLGIKCYWGRWITGHNVRLILIDSKEFMKKNINLIKKSLWENYKIDSLKTGFDYDEPIAWSTAAGILIEKLAKNKKFKKKKIVVHVHEWLSTGTLAHLLKEKVPVGLVFTTHATRIGRAKSYSGENLIKEVTEGLKNKTRFKDNDAYKYKLEAQHMVEKFAANHSDVFTAVSDIVSQEAKYILNKEADVITPNSLDFDVFFTTETLTILHSKYRKRINEFLEAYFSPYHPVEMKDNIVFFISGRYEFLNKGVDLFIEALGKLNNRLKKKQNLKKNIFAFILIPAGIKEPKQELLESIIQYHKLKSLLTEQFYEMKEGVINQILDGKKIDFKSVMDKRFVQKSVAWSHFFSRFRGKDAPLCAFELTSDEKDDEIINHLKKNKLLNKADDKVRVIFYPTYLSPTDGLLGMSYQDFVIATSMGVFPSRYEPWGYTPFETAALRVLSVTTDMAGFGYFIQNYAKKLKKESAIKVLKVMNRDKENVVEDLTDILEECVFLDKEERTKAKMETRYLVEKLDWKYQIKHYVDAHKLAIKEMKKRLK
jgi:glycogen(starch) synthase